MASFPKNFEVLTKKFFENIVRTEKYNFYKVRNNDLNKTTTIEEEFGNLKK